MQNLGSFDYVIVGAGSAGCLLANRLSRDPGRRVLLLEAGGRDDYFWIDIPVGYLYTIANPRTDWCYRTEPDERLAGRSIHYARGKVLGGCSSINAMIYMRGQKEDWDHWAALGNRGWSWEDVLPVFRSLEDYERGAEEGYGAGGEVRIENPRVRWEIIDAWREAAAECGIPAVKMFNGGDNFGCAYFQMNQKRGRRWSATNAFLRPAMHRPNLVIMTAAHVSRVRLEGGSAVGVEFTHRGANLRAEARGETILAAGAIGSPQLLQLSGIGPGELLKKNGIEPVHELRGVGENLHDHLQIRMQYKVRNVKTLNDVANSALGKAAMALEYFLFRTGPLTMPPSQAGAFAKSDPAQPTPNIEWHVQPLSLDKFGDPLHSFPAITPSVCNLRPSSRGSVRIKSRDPAAYPEIRLNYLSTEEDRRVAVEGMRFTRRIMAAKALSRYQPEEYRPGAGVTTETELARAAGELGTTIFHPVGTCRMGRDAMAVVDDDLRVHGIGRLRVIDASVFPRITSGNTNAPTYVVAEKGATAILKSAVHAPNSALDQGETGPMKRIVLFLATNLAVLVVLSFVLNVLGVGQFLTANGIDIGSLLVFSVVVGFAGSIISLLISKPMAKWSTGAHIVDGSEGTTEYWLVATVRKLAEKAGIGMPEVAIFEGAPNAFATGAFKNSALVAVSSGLLQTMNRDEIEAVLGHEVSHVANGDMVTLTLIQGVVNTFVIFLSRIIGYIVDKAVFRTERGVGPGFFIASLVSQIVLGILASIIVAWFSRRREFRADAGSADLLATPRPMINALARLGGAPQGDLPQSFEAHGIAQSPSRFLGLFASHPPIEERIAALQARVQ